MHTVSFNQRVCVIFTVLLGLTICSYLIANGDLGTPSGLYSSLLATEIQYVAANQTSHEIFLKLQNRGNTSPSFDKIKVNGAEVTTITPLPITMEADLDYKTLIFKYEGVWEGIILIEVLDMPTVKTDGYIVEKRVDLQVVSENSIKDAYPSTSELDAVFWQHHKDEIALATIGVTMTIMLSISTFVIIFLYKKGPSSVHKILVLLAFVLLLVATIVRVFPFQGPTTELPKYPEVGIADAYAIPSDTVWDGDSGWIVKMTLSAHMNSANTSVNTLRINGKPLTEYFDNVQVTLPLPISSGQTETLVLELKEGDSFTTNMIIEIEPILADGECLTRKVYLG